VQLQFWYIAWNLGNGAASDLGTGSTARSFIPTGIVRMRGQTIHLRATISTESCRAIHMFRTVSARRALHSIGAVMAASIHAT